MDSATRVVSVSWKYIAILQNEFIYGGYLTSLGSPILVLCAAMLLNTWQGLAMPGMAAILGIAYLIPLVVYSFNFYMEQEKDHVTNPERARLAARKAVAYPLMIVLYGLLMGAALLYTNLSLAVFTAALVLSGILYTPVFKSMTRRIPGFKSVYTSLIWACDGAFLLPFYDPAYLRPAIIFIFLFMFVKSLINTAFFDLKDVEADKAEGLKTIPAVLGKDKALRLLRALNLIAFIPLLAGVFTGALPAFALALLALFAYTRTYLKKAERSGGTELRHMSYTLAEAEIILWPLLLAAGHVFL